MDDDKTVIPAYELSFGNRKAPICYFGFLGGLTLIFGIVCTAMPLTNYAVEVQYNNQW